MLMLRQYPNIIYKIITKSFYTHIFQTSSGFKLDADEILAGGKIDRGCLRDGTHELFESLNSTKVPVLVFSAGIGDTVSAILRHADLLMPTVHVKPK